MSENEPDDNDDALEDADALIERAVARIATIPAWSPDDDPFEHPAGIAAWDVAGELLADFVFDDDDTFAERDLRQWLSDALFARDADRVREVMIDAIERGAQVDPDDRYDPDRWTDAIERARATIRARRSKPERGRLGRRDTAN